MKEVKIKGKVFTEAEICDYGKKSIAKTRKILIIFFRGEISERICRCER